MDTQQNGWQPPHCPNPNCRHHNESAQGWRYRKHGFFLRRILPRRIQRFTCLHCRRTFSSQTFSITYWLKRPDIIISLMFKVVGGMANRQIARDLRASPSAVDRQISRLGRHCLLFHRQMLEGHSPPAEIAIDGFETFELSQYYPNEFHVAVEPETSFFNYFTDSELRRKGRMTKYQKKQRALLENRFGKPKRGKFLEDVTHLVATTLAGAEQAIIRSDLHKTYPRAFERVDCEIEMKRVASTEHRDRNNLLWEINRMDRMIRHSQAGHVRETLAWPKRRQRAAERLTIYLVWWNYMRKRWEKGARASPGMLKGVARKMLSDKEVLGKRLFRTLQGLPRRWSEYYDGSVVMRALPINAEHELSYAY